MLHSKRKLLKHNPKLEKSSKLHSELRKLLKVNPKLRKTAKLAPGLLNPNPLLGKLEAKLKNLLTLI